jgi:hypothetical protein
MEMTTDRQQRLIDRGNGLAKRRKKADFEVRAAERETAPVPATAC